MAHSVDDQVTQTKLVAAGVLFVATLLCGYVPARCILSQRLVQYAMFAGGGVLMATAFCHLIPEAHDTYKMSYQSDHMHSHAHAHGHHEPEAAALVNATTTTTFPKTTLANATATATPTLNQTSTESNWTTPAPDEAPQLPPAQPMHWPYVEMCLCTGFFFMYIVELLMVSYLTTHTHEHPCEPQHSGHGHGHNHTSSTGQLVGDASCSSASSTSGSLAACPTGSSVVVVPAEGCPRPADGSPASASAADAHDWDAKGGRPSTADHHGDHHDHHEHAHSKHRSASGRGHRHGNHLYKFIRGLLIVSAFLAHSIFEGFAIGSQPTTEQVWTLLFAISCHKLIIAAVVGLELYTATLESNLWTLVHLSLFSIMSPIGIVLFVVAQNTLHINSQDPTMILVQSFATGTLLYIVFVEILQPKPQPQAPDGTPLLYKDRYKLGKCVCMVTGFLLMVVILTKVDAD